jgi:hypothetical protein
MGDSQFKKGRESKRLALLPVALHAVALVICTLFTQFSTCVAMDTCFSEQHSVVSVS